MGSVHSSSSSSADADSDAGQLGAFLPVLVRLSGRRRPRSQPNGTSTESSSADPDLLPLASSLQTSLVALTALLTSAIDAVWSVREAEILAIEKQLLDRGDVPAEKCWLAAAYVAKKVSRSSSYVCAHI